MRSIQAILKIENALNKLGSSDYQNIAPWKMEEAINATTVNICRRKLPRKEATIKDVDDLQVLLKDAKLAGSDRNNVYFLSHKLPNDYFGYSRVTPVCDKGNCKSIRIPSELLEDGNVDELLADYSSSPSFEFEQSFHTLAGNKIKLYHNGDFQVKELEITYYKRPQYITIPGQAADGTIHSDMVWEFKDDMCELIIEETIQKLAGDIESINRYQISQQTVTKNE